MPRSTARVATDRPQRYAKQLASHLSRRSQTSWDEESGEGTITFSDGKGTMTAAEGALLLTVDADDEHLEIFEGVIGRHLVRFGTKDELVVQWQRDNGEAGTEQRKAED
jgi:hypothetical protein